MEMTGWSGAGCRRWGVRRERVLSLSCIVMRRDVSQPAASRSLSRYQGLRSDQRGSALLESVRLAFSARGLVRLRRR
uniref:Uncharacterized protein n=1 Tax=Anguilla anguilla TaxID=7936 RepID=A0A0E9W025_ANGAN